MKYHKWTPNEIADLIRESIPVSQEKYPDKTKNQLQTLRRYYINKLGEADMEKPPTGKGTNADRVAELMKPSKTWEVSAFDRVANEWTTTQNRSFNHDDKGRELTDFISQAAPVRITPSKRKPADRDYRLIFAFGDSQIDYRQVDGELQPIHDERALAVVRMMCREYQPEAIVNLGDTIDLAALSRFPADSDHFRHSLNPAFNRVHRLYAELRADNPNSEIHEVDSNHNTRLAKFILKQVPELYGLRQAGSSENYPTLTYPFLANLDAVGVQWHSGYGAAEFVYGTEYQAPPIVFKHGNTVVSNGSTAAKESRENPETHIIRGHGHKLQEHYRTNRAGQYLASIMLGCTCSVEGDVPSYHSAVDDLGHVVKSQEGWQQSVLMITDYMNGRYQFDNITIEQGKAFYEGREWDGNE